LIWRDDFDDYVSLARLANVDVLGINIFDIQLLEETIVKEKILSLQGN
jgi:hypothetical protein